AWGLHYAADTLLRSPGGHLVERYGLRPVLGGSALLALLCALALPFAPGTLGLALLAALHGAALSPLWPAAMTLSSLGAAEGKQARAVALVSAFSGPFTGLGFLGVGALSSLQFGGSQPHPTWGWALAALLLAQGLALGLALTLRSGPLHPETAARERPPASLRRTLAFLIPAALVQTLALSLLGPVITPFARRLGLGQWGVTALLLAGAASGYALLGLTGRLVERRGARPLLVLGLLLAALGLGLMAALPPLWVYFPLAALLGAGYACLLPGWGGLVSGALPQRGRAASWGVIMTAENVGMASGPLLGTLAWDSLGMRAPFLLGAGLFVLTAGVYLWPGFWPGWRQRRPSRQSG
ncbi:MAG: MFS transporter, partial [Deinococcus sp.]